MATVGVEAQSALHQMTPLDAAVESWRRFDLSNKKVALDKQARELREAKDQTVKARKRLAEATKDFRKKSESERSAQVDELLKSYQEEIDNLTRRAKSSDGMFLSLYQELYEAHDPTPILTAAIHDKTRASTLELEIGRLHREVQEYEEEFLKLKNQDITIRQLEDQIMVYESAMAERVEAALTQARQEIHHVAEARVQEAMERERRLEERLKRAERAQDEAQTFAEKAQAQLFEVSRQAEERAAARQAEYELLLQESDRRATEAHAAKRECESLRTKLQALTSGQAEATGTASSSNTRVEELETELKDVTQALATLRQRLMSKEDDWATQRAAQAARTEQLQQEFQTERERRVKAEAELEGRPTREQMESLRSELRVLQQLEFNVLPNDDDDDDRRHRPTQMEVAGESSTEDEDARHGHNMEQLLITRIRRMETEMMTARRRATDAETQTHKVTAQLRDAESRLLTQASLIQRLEDDLSNLYQLQAQSRSERSMSVSAAFDGPGSLPSPPPRKHSATFVGLPSKSETQSNEVDLSELINASVSTSNSRVTDEDGGVDLVKILQAQRDRYKHRVSLLEGEAESAANDVMKHKAHVEQLQKDNVALYEKIKFLQAYNHQASNPKPIVIHNTYNAPPGGKHSHSAMEDGVSELKYRAMYEEQINPFTQFSVAERARRYGELSVAEKATLHLTRFFLASKFARSFVFFYLVGLHLLVFATLYLWGAHHCDDLRLHDHMAPVDHIAHLQQAIEGSQAIAAAAADGGVGAT